MSAMEPDRDLVDQVRTALAAAGDPGKAVKQQAYMKSQMPFHGITSAQLTGLLKPLLAGHRIDDRDTWEATVRSLWDEATHREERYAALALTGHRAYHPWQDPEALPLYRHLVVTGAWWDHVDAIAANRVGPILRAHREQVTEQVSAWATDDDLWLRRTAILAQLKHKGDTDLELLDHAVRSNTEHSPHGRDFFIRKGLGWALREHARTDPAWVRRILVDLGDDLSRLTHREATKHLR